LLAKKVLLAWGVIAREDRAVWRQYKNLACGYLAPTHESGLGIEEESVTPGSGFGADAGKEL
jgi:hypothetical protein